MTGASFEAACDASGDFAGGQTRLRSTAENGIAKSAGITQDTTDITTRIFQDEDDDLDTGDDVRLTHPADANSAQREVTAQVDYMGSGGSPIVNANYSTEGTGPNDVGADCVLFGTSQTA